jgi:hypothetical protein
MSCIVDVFFPAHFLCLFTFILFCVRPYGQLTAMSLPVWSGWGGVGVFETWLKTFDKIFFLLGFGFSLELHLQRAMLKQSTTVVTTSTESAAKWNTYTRNTHTHFFFVTQPNLGLSRLNVEASNHTKLDTHTLGLLWTSAQLVAEAATDTTHKKPKRRTSIHSAAFEPAIPGVKGLRTHVPDRTATGIGQNTHLCK